MVPKAIDSATSRLGFFTSAAVNPMLFQASAENSEPTCATPNATNNPNAPLAAVMVGTQPRRKSAPGSIGYRAANRPEVRKIIADGRGVAAHKHAEKNQSQQRKRFRAGENILN